MTLKQECLQNYLHYHDDHKLNVPALGAREYIPQGVCENQMQMFLVMVLIFTSVRTKYITSRTWSPN